MTETLPSSSAPQIYLWSLNLILDSTNVFVSVADSSNFFVELKEGLIKSTPKPDLSAE